mgnify:CR=1 FL=1
MMNEHNNQRTYYVGQVYQDFLDGNCEAVEDFLQNGLPYQVRQFYEFVPEMRFAHHVGNQMDWVGKIRREIRQRANNPIINRMVQLVFRNAPANEATANLLLNGGLEFRVETPNPNGINIQDILFDAAVTNEVLSNNIRQGNNCFVQEVIDYSLRVGHAFAVPMLASANWKVLLPALRNHNFKALSLLINLADTLNVKDFMLQRRYLSGEAREAIPLGVLNRVNSIVDIFFDEQPAETREQQRFLSITSEDILNTSQEMPNAHRAGFFLENDLRYYALLMVYNGIIERFVEIHGDNEFEREAGRKVACEALGSIMSNNRALRDARNLGEVNSEGIRLPEDVLKKVRGFLEPKLNRDEEDGKISQEVYQGMIATRSSVKAATAYQLAEQRAQANLNQG